MFFFFLFLSRPLYLSPSIHVWNWCASICSLIRIDSIYIIYVQWFSMIIIAPILTLLPTCLTQVAMSFPDAFSSGQDGLVRRWSLQDSCCLQEFQAHQDAVRCPAEWVALVISGGSNWFPPTRLWLYIVFILGWVTEDPRWRACFLECFKGSRYDGCHDAVIDGQRFGGAWRWIGSRNSCWLGVSIYPCDYGLSIPRCLDMSWSDMWYGIGVVVAGMML